MKLTLKTPFDPGMNDPGNTYPDVYITQMTDNPGGNNFSFVYEAGSFVTVEGAEDADGVKSPDTTVWSKGPGCLSQMATVSNDDYVKATKAPILKATDSAYQSIRRILYSKLIASGLDGEIVDT
jgi:hypothetical protein